MFSRHYTFSTPWCARRLFGNLRISFKIYSIVALLAVVAGCIAAISLSALNTFQREAEAMKLSAERAIIGEKVNGLINAVVMESRGVYMSRDTKDAKRFADPMIKGLDEIAALMTRWNTIVRPDQRETFDRAHANARKFVEFRKELARLGTEVAPEKGREWGDNDANRTNHQAFNKEILALAAANAANIDEVNRRIDALHDSLFTMIVLVALVGIAAGIAVAWLISNFQIARPIIGMTGVMKALAAGDHGVVIPATDPGTRSARWRRPCWSSRKTWSRPRPRQSARSPSRRHARRARA
jgi:methyl-accepting chemotaxis protein